MTDVEFITAENHRRAREKELGERWEMIVQHRKRQNEALKTAENVCVVVACMAAGAAAVFFGVGYIKAAFVTLGVVAAFAFGAVAFYEP